MFEVLGYLVGIGVVLLLFSAVAFIVVNIYDFWKNR